MRSDFNWNDAEEVIVFKTVQGVAVYRNEDGDVVIRQQAGPLEEEDTFIVVPSSHLEPLITALQTEAKEA